jgi:hypothetical protein
MKHPIRFPALFILLLSALAAAEQAPFQPVKLIDMPTAGALLKAQYSLDFKFFADGGLSTAVGVGITNRFSIGVAYELMRIIGQRGIRGQAFPGGFVKYRLMEESYYLPGLALGFDSQGSGVFYRKSDGDYYPRFYFKSKGFFAALSKSYLFLGQPLGLHYEINYSAVDNQAESEGHNAEGGSNRSVNMGLGLDKSFNDELSTMVEYDLALDDNHTHNPFKGYLNACVRWSIVKNFAIELDFKDILENKVIAGATQDMNREVRIVYIDKF